MGGRALRAVLYPLVSAEIPDFDLHKAIHNGMLPRHYLAKNPQRRLQAYIGDYLNEEIRAEAISRNLISFTRFMERNGNTEIPFQQFGRRTFTAWLG